MARKRWTNKRIVEELFPVVQRAVRMVRQGKIEFKDRDAKGKPFAEKVMDKYTVRFWEFEPGHYVIEAYMFFPRGRYDYAAVNANVRPDGVFYGYWKEFRGLGHGYYAELDEEGRIVRAEWD